MKNRGKIDQNDTKENRKTAVFNLQIEPPSTRPLLYTLYEQPAPSLILHDVTAQVNLLQWLRTWSSIRFGINIDILSKYTFCVCAFWCKFSSVLGDC